MSFDAIRWALAQQVDRSSAKFVLVAMADCVNADDEPPMVCWPSYRHLTERTGQDVKTVEAGLRRLREAGFIEDTGDRRGGTGQVVVYRLTTPATLPARRLSTPEKNERAPNLGHFDTAGNTPVFPSKTPVFPVKDPQISHESPPKTGDGTSNGTSKRTSKEEVRLDGVDPQLLLDYMAVRKAKKAGPLTPTAVRSLIREAQKAGLTLAEAVEKCCEYGWQGFNAGWYLDRTRSAQRPTASPYQQQRIARAAEFAPMAAVGGSQSFDFDLEVDDVTPRKLG